MSEDDRTVKSSVASPMSVKSSVHSSVMIRRQQAGSVASSMPQTERSRKIENPSEKLWEGGGMTQTNQGEISATSSQQNLIREEKVTPPTPSISVEKPRKVKTEGQNESELVGLLEENNVKQVSSTPQKGTDENTLVSYVPSATSIEMAPIETVKSSSKPMKDPDEIQIRRKKQR
eukprot:UN25474